MKAFLICFFLFITLSAEAQFEKAVKLDEHKGLIGSDIKLGMKMKDLPDLKPVYSNLKNCGLVIESYENCDENLILGDVNLTQVKYYIYDDKVSHIWVRFNQQDYENVNKELSKIYGLSSFVPKYPYGELFGWRGKKVILHLSNYTKDIFIFYSESYLKSIHKANIKFLNKAMFKQPFEYYEEGFSKSKRQQRKIIKKRIRLDKKAWRKNIKLFKHKLKDYESSKYVK